ncbi:MAG: hypothetical protein R3E64_11915 [Halioglobus sp.]
MSKLGPAVLNLPTLPTCKGPAIVLYNHNASPAFTVELADSLTYLSAPLAV